jgi:hypothetical protein
MRIWAATAKESTTGRFSMAGQGATGFEGAPGEGGGDEARLSRAPPRHPDKGTAGVVMTGVGVAALKGVR